MLYSLIPNGYRWDGHSGMMYNVIGQAKWLMANCFAQLSKTLRLDLMLYEGAWEDEALPVQICFHEQDRTANAIQRNWLAF